MEIKSECEQSNHIGCETKQRHVKAFYIFTKWNVNKQATVSTKRAYTKKKPATH